MTEAPAPPLPELRLRLPGKWWQVPLHDEVEARASIRQLVERQVGRADDRAALRNELRTQFFAALESAIKADGQAMHLALDFVEGEPMSASVTVFLPPIGMTPAIGTSGKAVIDLLEQGLRQTPGQELEGLVHFDTAESRVLRTQKRVLANVVDAEGERAELETLVAEYWMSIPGTKRVILLVFTTIFVALEEVMLDFFDSIVRVAYWERPKAAKLG